MRERLIRCGWAIVFVLLAGCSRATPSAPVVVDQTKWRHYLAAIDQAETNSDPVQRCLASPDLPGNDWTPGSAKARCSLLGLTASPTLQELDSILQQPDGAAKLDHLYAQILDSHYRDPSRREAIFLAYQDFGSHKDSRRVAETWFARSPKSAYALMAMGQQLAADRILVQAVDLLDAALAKNPRLSPACVNLMSMGRLSGDYKLRDRAIKHCLAIDPLSWNVMFEWQLTMDPRWGGSVEQVDSTVEVIRKRLSQNPALGGMLSRGIGLRSFALARRGRWDEAAPGLEEAARIAPDPFFIGHAGVAAQRHNDFSKALGYLSQAIRLAPNSDYFLSIRAKVRNRMGNYAAAATDAERAIALNDNYGAHYSFYGEALAGLGRRDEARTAFHNAMQFRDQRQWAFRQWCETYITPSMLQQEALACTQGLVKDYPEDPQALFMRAWVLRKIGDSSAGEVADLFYAAMDSNDARQREMAEQLRTLMGKQ